MKLLFLSVLSMAVSLAMLSAAPINSSHAKWDVNFLAIGHPSAIKVHGESNGANAVSAHLNWEQGSLNGKASLQLKSLTTGISLRDHHMKEKYLQVDKYPVATIDLTKVDLPQSFQQQNASANGVPFQGNLTLHGVTRPVSGKVDAEKSGKDLKLTFHFDTSLSNFQITKPEFMGISIKDKVAVDVAATDLELP